MRLQIIFATGNENKIREIREIATDPKIHIRSMKQAGIASDPDENGSSFEENALIKATAVANAVAQNPSCLEDPDAPVIVMSDDSGLAIDALGGEPGIHSARFMGHDTSYTLKMQAILDQLKDVPDEKRTARFVAAVSAVVPRGVNAATDALADKFSTITIRGTMEGAIGHTIAGENGFGYDPFFYLPDLGLTSAEISPEEKNARSHRGKALRAMMKTLESFL